MTNIFMNAVHFSIQAGFLVIALVILRLILHKAPRFIICALWSLVAVRLIVPFQIESILSVAPTTETLTVITEELGYAVSQHADLQTTIIEAPISGTPVFAATSSVSVYQIAAYVWIAGMIIMLLYAVISYLRLRRMTREKIEIEKGVYLCDRVPSPFILGIIQPKIFLSSGISEHDKPFVLAHERAHIKRRDHIWKPLGFLLLSVYWFNPLLWVAYVLLCRDIELACDEKVIREMGFDIKKPYAIALINSAASRRLISACPLAFGETSVKSRIKNVLSYKKPAFWIIIVTVVLSIAAAVCFLTDPPRPDQTDIQLPDDGQISTPDSLDGRNIFMSDTTLEKLEPNEAVNRFFELNYDKFLLPPGAKRKEWSQGKAKAVYYGGTYLDGGEQVIRLTDVSQIDSFVPVGRDIRYEKCKYSLVALENTFEIINDRLDAIRNTKNKGFTDSIVEISLLESENKVEICIFDMTDEKIKWFKETICDMVFVVFRNVTTNPREDISEETVSDIPAVIFTNGETVYISGDCGIIFYDIKDGKIRGMLSPTYLKELGFAKLYAIASLDGDKIYLYDMSDGYDPVGEKCGVFDLTNGTITTCKASDVGNDDLFSFDSVAYSIMPDTLISVKDGTTYELSVPGKKLENMKLTVKNEDGTNTYQVFEAYQDSE